MKVRRMRHSILALGAVVAFSLLAPASVGADCVGCQIVYGDTAICVWDNTSPWTGCRVVTRCRDRCIMFAGQCVIVPYCWETCTFLDWCTFQEY